MTTDDPQPAAKGDSRYHRILVAVDLGDSAPHALREARAIASACNAELAMIHVLPDFVSLSTLHPDGYAGSLPAMEQYAATARSKIREWTQRAESESNLELKLERGAAATKIIEVAESWGAELIVVGSHGHDEQASTLKGVLLGSVAKKVVHNAHCPVLVSRKGAIGQRVIAATDLSDPSLPAISAGAAEARRRGARLEVVHVVDPAAAVYAASAGGLLGLTIALPPPEIQAEVKLALLDTLQQAIHRLGAEGDAVVLYGDPAKAIVEHASQRGPALIVVGTHGRSGLRRIALGSVADEVTRAAPCSVLVVRHQE
ncbi:MAG TPA: universal stress protein [Polyangiaceae bacterium]|nr:universal stress protein [Polyangiaceae bacterium]